MNATTKRLQAHVSYIYANYYAAGAAIGNQSASHRHALFITARDFSHAAKLLAGQARTMVALEGHPRSAGGAPCNR